MGGLSGGMKLKRIHLRGLHITIIVIKMFCQMKNSLYLLHLFIVLTIP